MIDWITNVELTTGDYLGLLALGLVLAAVIIVEIVRIRR